MGAATALLHTHRDPSIAAMILDSPFADLRQRACPATARVHCLTCEFTALYAVAGELVEVGKARSGYR